MKRPIAFLFLLLFGLGIFFRLWQLGLAAFSADNMEFYKLALRNQDIVELWKNPPWLNQIPLNETLSLLLVKAGLPVAPFVVRLPFALMGILALVFVWRFARRRAGTPAAALVLLLAVFNPYQLYFSRTAYHYSGALCWSAALFCIFWSIKEKLETPQVPALRSVTLWFAAAAVACHMHMSVWVVAGLQGILLLWFGWRGLRTNSAALKRFFIPTFIGAGLLGLLLSPWIRRALQRLGEAVSGGKQLLGAEAGSEFARLFPAYFAGENLFAVALLFIFMALCVVALFQHSENSRRFRSLAWISVLHIGVVMLYIVIIGGGVAKISYFSAIWPMFILFLGIGASLGIQTLSVKWRVLQFLLWPLLAGGYIALTIVPDWAIVHLEGKARPYWKISQWMDTRLPAGTPVLVDRWYHPWNELAVHPSTNVFYTFTVPDDPIDSFRRFNWRATAEQFFTKYPSAAFLEVSRGKYKEDFGLWKFPEHYFAQRVSITNRAAMTLRRFKVFPTTSYAKANTNGVVTRIFYNTPEDLAAAARREGRRVLRLYGEGWGYAKPGWQRGDFSDYRILTRTASMELYNLTEASVPGTLEISAATAQKPKMVSVNGKSTVFAAGRIKSWKVPLALKTGRNTIPFTSPSSDPLFVRDIRWTFAQP